MTAAIEYLIFLGQKRCPVSGAKAERGEDEIAKQQEARADNDNCKCQTLRHQEIIARKRVTALKASALEGPRGPDDAITLARSQQ